MTRFTILVNKDMNSCYIFGTHTAHNYEVCLQNSQSILILNASTFHNMYSLIHTIIGHPRTQLEATSRKKKDKFVCLTTELMYQDQHIYKSNRGTNIDTARVVTLNSQFIASRTSANWSFINP
jgi:hypothetical protein